MNKWVLGLILGGILGTVDGSLAPVFAPETRDQMIPIIIGSTFKGFITGFLIGFFAKKVNNLFWGIVFGLAVGTFLAFLVALGNGYYFQVMLQGAALGIILGYVTQRYGAQTVPTK